MLVFITFPHLNTTPFKDTIHLMFVGLKRQIVMAVNRRGISLGRVRNGNTQVFHSKVRPAMLKIVQKKQQIQHTKEIIRWVFTVL